MCVGILRILYFRGLTFHNDCGDERVGCILIVGYIFSLSADKGHTSFS
ncbi:hypothetical protein KL86DYS2_10230 [uncultured Dysgonomonas sp.]|uniref:Uncharacterized protein n=1 Tax=uncultured Dysgonomonas sp. TaxID=206096 RepID=A0A212IX05_9BACT|nr:hypothetical protein KL86DYS2_10230 [uncultured Dysgonomonas sp.]